MALLTLGLIQLCTCWLVLQISTAHAQEQAICGTVEYDPDRQKCCSGTLHSWDNRNRMVNVCCGAHFYNNMDGRCCAGIVYDLIPYLNEYGSKARKIINCCWDNLYNRKTEKCCGSVINPRFVNGEPAKCCGQTHYIIPVSSLQIETCCSKTVVPYLGPDALCCGRIAYLPATHTCCKKRVFPRTQAIADNGMYPYYPRRGVNTTAECCGGALYDAEDYVCCGTKVFPPQPAGGRHMICCHEWGLYNTAFMACRADGIYDLRRIPNR